MRARYTWLGVALGLLSGLFVTLNARGYYVTGEALYWQPLTSGIDFGYTFSTADPFVPDHVFGTCPEYAWGGRIRAGRGCASCFVEGSYLWYESRSFRTAYRTDLSLVGPDFLQEFLSLTGTTKDRYQTAYLRVGCSLGRGCGIQAGAFAQLRWASVSEFRGVSGLAERAPDPAATLTASSVPQFWGVGPGIGLGASTPLCLCGLSLFTELEIGALIGKHGSGNDVLKIEPATETIQTGHINWDECSSVVPFGEFALGLGYCLDCGCVRLNLFAAYELHYLWGAIAYAPSAHGQILEPPVNQLSVVDVGLQRQRMDVGFGGLTLGVAIEF